MRRGATPPVQEAATITDSPFCAVIGAGPAGLLAAERLARAGAQVVIYEHKPSPARKFLMAGRGGLNLTHSEPIEKFLTRYGAAARRLAPCIAAFPPQALRDVCAELGEETFVGSSGRVFPKSFKTSPLLRALLRRLAGLGVTIEIRRTFEGFGADGEIRLRDPGGALLTPRPAAVILALGGASWPRLGSDGGWVKILGEAGVTMTPLAPANCGAKIDWRPRLLEEFEGQPLKTTLLRCEGRSARGDVIVTRTGLEGGPVYALSSQLRETTARDGSATLLVDLRPDTSAEILTQKLRRRPPKQSQANFLRKVGLSRLEIAVMRESQPEGLPKDAAKLAALIKAAPLVVHGVSGLERAISTAGGVAFSELTDDLMLKKLPGVFVCGEMLDFDAPTGGYLLQAAFSTGVAAGEAAARWAGLAPQPLPLQGRS